MNDPKETAMPNQEELGENPGTQEDPAQEESILRNDPWLEKLQDRRAKREGRGEDPQARQEAHREETQAKQEARREETQAHQEARREETQARQEARQEEAQARREARQEEAQNRREEREAQRQARREEREAQRDEKEDSRARRREESPRRAGTLTMGLVMVLVGAAILASMILPDFSLSWLAWLAPVILILLGLEIILRYALGRGRDCRYDIFSGFFCLLVAAVCLVMAGVQDWLPYVSPVRDRAQRQLHQQLEDEVYQLLRPQTNISDLSLDISVEPKPMVKSTGTVEDYEVVYAHVRVHLTGEYPDKEAFAADCYEVTQRLNQLEDLRSVDIVGYGPNQEYELYLSGVFQRNMDAEAMAGQVTVTKYQPDPADGWMPGGYDEMVDAYGQEYADQWLDEMVRRQNERIGAQADRGDAPPADRGDAADGPQEAADTSSSTAA